MTTAMSLFHPHASHGGKSSIRKWFEHAAGPITVPSARQAVHHGISTLRYAGEGIAVGGLLGLAKCELKEGLDPGGMPLDLGVAALSFAGGLVMPDLALDSRVITACALASYTARKTEELLNAKKAGMHGDFGNESEDPIITAARGL